MILALQPITPDSTLNDFTFISNIQFIAGSGFKITVQLNQTVRKQRYIPDAASTMVFKLLKSDNTTLSKSASFKFADDRSIIEATLTDLEAANLIGQNLVLEITEPSGLSVGVLQKGLQQIVPVQDC